MTTLVRVPDMLYMDLGIEIQPKRREFERNFGLFDRRQLARELRRIHRMRSERPARMGARWWLMFRKACRKYGVRA